MYFRVVVACVVCAKLVSYLSQEINGGCGVG